MTRYSCIQIHRKGECVITCQCIPQGVLMNDNLRPFYPRGGGGALGYLRGCIRSLSKLKNTPKALISGQKSTLILIKR